MSLVIRIQFEACLLESLIKVKDDDRKKILLEHANATEDNEEIIGDFVLSLLKHLLDCGCSSSQTASAMNFCLDFIKNSCSGNLIDAVRTLHQALPRFTSLDSNQLSSTLEFLNKTYLTHFTLYKYLLTIPRDQDYTNLEKCVCVPDSVAPLSTAKPEAQWIYEEKVANIKKKYSALAREITDKEEGEPANGSLDCTQRVSRETLQILVEKFIKQECEGIEKKLDKVLKLSEIHLTKEIALIEAKSELSPSKVRSSSKISVSPRRSPGRKSKSPKGNKK